jgi:HSP20 family protein
MNELFENSMVRPTDSVGRMLSAPMDVYAQGDNYVVEIGLPGVNPDSVDVSVQDNVVTVSGEFGTSTPRQGEAKQGEAKQGENKQGDGQTTEHSNRRYLHREMKTGRFERSITLPTDVNADAARAECKNGMLCLTLPKAESAKRKRIAIGSGQHQQTTGTSH